MPRRTLWERLRVSRAGERVLAIANLLIGLRIPLLAELQRSRFGATPKPARGTRALPRKSLNPREQRRWFADYMSIRPSPPLRVRERKPFFLSAQFNLPIQLIENSMRAFGITGEIHIAITRITSVR